MKDFHSNFKGTKKINVTIKNDFSDEDSRLVVRSNEKSMSYRIGCREKQVVPLPVVTDLESEHSLIIGIDGNQDLPLSKVSIPEKILLTFTPDDLRSITLSRNATGAFLKIPEGPSSWELKLTAPPIKTNSFENTTTSETPEEEENNVTITVGENDEGG